ncbi:MAG: hypothetical protein U9Q97_06660 [Acidobacteriota bacterium]|nr:hypothetical protein [Acidobacteriota bacterium]
MEETNKNLVKDYKEKNANVFSLGMAINNAAVIASGTHKAYSSNEMKALIKGLFELYKEIRKEELGY